MTLVCKVLLVVFAVSLNFCDVNSRIQLNPPEEIKVERIPNGPPCTLDIDKDLPDPQPLFLQPGSSEFWPVEVNGSLEIPHGSDIELHCTQGFYMNSKDKSINATCLEYNTFLVKQEKVQMPSLNCTSQVKFTIRGTENKCADNAKIYELGFNVSIHRFPKTLDICYDKMSVKTFWTYNKLDAASGYFQKLVQRPNFSKAGFFDKRNMNYLYSKENQEQIFQKLLGENYEKFFNSRTQFLARGHISAKADHIYGTQQYATFHFLNVAPQWQIFNAATWNAVENGVRKLLTNKGLEVECYAGTWGVISLPNNRSEPREIYLTFDANNNGEIPVPKLFYKAIIDTKSKPKRGIVLIGVNNPYLSMDELKRDYLICDDVSESVPWIKWTRDNIEKGYFYACEVDDFTRAVNVLPNSLKNVSSLLV